MNRIRTDRSTCRMSSEDLPALIQQKGKLKGSIVNQFSCIINKYKNYLIITFLYNFFQICCDSDLVTMSWDCRETSRETLEFIVSTEHNNRLLWKVLFVYIVSVSKYISTQPHAQKFWYKIVFILLLPT